MGQPSKSSVAPQEGATKATTEKIPPLVNIATAIFVPLQEDVTKPVGSPRDRIERLKIIIEAIESQRAGVRENLVWMFERERKRIMMEAKAKELAEGLENAIKPGLPTHEVDFMVRNMEAPAQPGMDYNIKEVMEFMPPIPPRATSRDKVAYELLNLMDNGAKQLSGFDVHISAIKNEYLGYLEKEIARVENVGKRPEER